MYVDELCDGLRDAYHEALKFSDASHQRNKRLYDRRANVHRYKVGDSVLVHRAAVKRGEYDKFRRPWVPAVVEAVKGDVFLRVRLEDGKVISVHHNKLKPRTFSAVEADVGRPAHGRQTQATSAEVSIESAREDSPYGAVQLRDSGRTGVTLGDGVGEAVSQSGSLVTSGPCPVSVGGETSGPLAGDLSHSPTVPRPVSATGETGGAVTGDPLPSSSAAHSDSGSVTHSRSPSILGDSSSAGDAVSEPVHLPASASALIGAPVSELGSLPGETVVSGDAHSSELDSRVNVPRRSSRKTKPVDRFVLRLILSESC